MTDQTSFTQLNTSEQLFGWIGGTLVDINAITAIEPFLARTDNGDKVPTRSSVIHLMGSTIRVNAEVATIQQWMEQLRAAQNPEPEPSFIEDEVNEMGDGGEIVPEFGDN